MEKADKRKPEGAIRFIFIVMLSFILASFFAIISKIGLPSTYLFATSMPRWFIITFSLLALLLFLYSFGTVPYTFRGIGLPGPPMWIQYLLSFVGIILFLSTIPALIIYWIVKPENLKWTIKIGVFFSSTSLAVIYYLCNRKAFKSPADKVSFFSGVCLGPSAIVQIFMD